MENTSPTRVLFVASAVPSSPALFDVPSSHPHCQFAYVDRIFLTGYAVENADGDHALADGSGCERTT